MRRSKGLKSGKGLKKSSSLRSKTKLEANKGLDRKSKLSYRSEKTKEVYKDRRDIVVKLLAERPLCEACHVFMNHDNQYRYHPRGSVDIHEILSRARGGSIMDEDNLLAVCRTCHQRITENPELSEFLGLAIPSRTSVPDSLKAAKIRRQEFLDKGGR